MPDHHYKRSFVINGKTSSVSIEPYFWSKLKEIASTTNQSVASLLGEIDYGRLHGPEHCLNDNRSSACRIFVARYFEGLAKGGSS